MWFQSSSTPPCIPSTRLPIHLCTLTCVKHSSYLKSCGGFQGCICWFPRLGSALFKSLFKKPALSQMKFVTSDSVSSTTISIMEYNHSPQQSLLGKTPASSFHELNDLPAEIHKCHETNAKAQLASANIRVVLAVCLFPVQSSKSSIYIWHGIIS